MSRSIPLPWNDRTGRLSPMKAAVFAALFVPGTIATVQYLLDDLGPRPLTAYIHWMGLWTVRLLLLSLLVTPLRQILRYPALVNIRRMLGVGAFAYIAIHFCLYVADQSFSVFSVASEIVKRFYLTIGFTVLVLLAALAATSTDGMVRRLGGARWQRLHRLIYPAAILGTIHYFIQSKADVWEPTIAGGLLFWLLAYRVSAWLGGTARATAIPTLVAISLGSWVFTAIGEAVYYWLHNNLDPMRVIDLNIAWLPGVQPRPGWVVLGMTLAVVVAAAIRNLTSPAGKRRAPQPVLAQ
jgi:methionine sulfoxide reductase heme-binding subunit